MTADIVKAWTDRNGVVGVRVRCPYCRQTHVHGWVGGGSRQADCSRGGYDLVDSDHLVGAA